MIHALIDTVEHRQILGFETGNRSLFDKRKAGDPLWVFVDFLQVKYQVNTGHFLINPRKYKVDRKGNLRLDEEPPIIIEDEIPPPIPGYIPLRGPDGAYLKGDDGNFLYGYADGFSPPPEGEVYLLDSDDFFLTDSDGFFLTELLEEPLSTATFIVDDEGNFFFDTSFSFIIDSE